MFETEKKKRSASKKYIWKTEKNATTVAIVPLGTVATAQNLNRRVKKKEEDLRNYCCSYSVTQ